MGEAAAKEPSMEDILSSIRKIISEEDPSGEGTASAQPPQNPSPATSGQATAQTSNATEQQTVELSTTQAESADDNTATEGMSLKQLADDAKAAQSGASASQVESNQPIPQRESIAVNQDSGASLSDIAASVTPAQHSSQESETSIEGASNLEKIQPSSTEPMNPTADVAPEVAAPVSASSANVEEPAPTAPAQSYQPTKAEEEAFRGALVSPSTDSAVNESFERLKRSAMDDMEAKTEAILRPMLREWLDNNLPSLVERLVREEIERVSRGI